MVLDYCGCSGERRLVLRESHSVFFEGLSVNYTSTEYCSFATTGDSF